MKYIQIKFILCGMFAFLSFYINAQTFTENGVDSLNNGKDSLVQVAYRKIASSDLPGGVSMVDVKELIKKNYYTYSLDNMEGYIGGWNGNSLWGMDSYLVLVDGIPRDASSVLPEEIEQITFLKGASAVVLYGSRAAKGVIYISTKKGKAEPFKINARANTGFHVSKRYPKYLGSAEYMSLYNEARENDDLQPLYSEEDIYHYSTGENPYRYPDIDFYSSDYLKKAYNRSDIMAEFTGGTNRARFYTNIGYARQGDVFNFGEAKNNYSSRLNIRGKVDVTFNDYISASVNANTVFNDSRGANGDYWAAASTMRPNRLSPLIPLDYIEENDINSWTLIKNSSNIIGGKYFLGGTQIDMTNIFADYYAAGYNKSTTRLFQFDTGIDFDLSSLLKGLSFHTQFAVDYATSYRTSYDNEYAVFEPVWSNYNGKDVIAGLTKYGNDRKPGVQNISESTFNQTLDFSGAFNYETSINTIHNISAVLVAAGYQQTQSGVYHRTANANLGLQLDYNYRDKYFAEIGSAIVHSAKLAEGHRNAFSPSLTLGWKLHNEDFLKNSPVVDEFVLNASGSILHTDLDISDFYMYTANYTQAEGAWWGWYDGAVERSTNSLRGSNEDLTFIKRKEFSLNARTSLWHNLINADVSFFINSMEGMIIRPSTIFPNYFFTYWPEASFIPYLNYNNDKRIGFDFNVKFNERIEKVDLSLGVGGTYYDTEATQRDENYEWAYQNRVGRPVDGIWGLQSEGFFQHQEEIDNSPEQKFGGTVKPGDIKYVDQNRDNVIDEKDEIFLGRGGWYGTPFTLGVNLTAKWNNFTLFVLGTGNYGAYGLKNSSYYWIYGDRKYSEVVRGRWTEETKKSATFPRLTTESGSNNFRNSDFWLYKTDRFNLAKVQLTYDFPKRMLHNFFLHEISCYVSGSNLLTISNEREILEMNITSAPQTRFYNLGVKVVF